MTEGELEAQIKNVCNIDPNANPFGAILQSLKEPQRMFFIDSLLPYVVDEKLRTVDAFTDADDGYAQWALWLMGIT